ncbi:MAG TPA: hypothetical protein VGQ25_01210 [Gemmatimonadales bacterium]|jgi:hypothetical protein|nr:hypothetical protein [Gemmatimonadales bacterium]
MSSRIWSLALLCAAAAPSTRAQGPDALTLQRLRADSLLRAWREASAIAELVDSLDLDRARAGKDTISVGTIRIIANPSPLPLREAAHRAWPVIDSLYGSEAQRLTDWPYVIHAVDPDTALDRAPVRVGMSVPWDLDVEALTVLLLRNVPAPPPDAGLATWLGGPVRPAAPSPSELGAVYVELVTAPSQSARSCFLGDLAGCRFALSLGGGDAHDTFERWYPSPAERRRLVTVSLSHLGRGETQASFLDCAAGRDAACTELLRSVPSWALPSPLSPWAHRTLLQVALRLGGREAYHRLLASPDAPLAARLGAAAGVGIDSLVARWRDEILASRPRPVSLPPWGAWVAVGWVAFFAACGLRSSRWRLG